MAKLQPTERICRHVDESDEAQQVLEDEGDHSAEAQYVRERNANQIEELSTLFGDFTAAVSLAASKAAIRIWHPPTADPLIL